MKNMTDFRKTVETAVDPRLVLYYAFFLETCVASKITRKLSYKKN